MGAVGAVGAGGTVEARALSRRLKALVNALPVTEGAEEAQLLALYPAGVDRSKPSEIAALIAALDARQARHHPVVTTPTRAHVPWLSPPRRAAGGERGWRRGARRGCRGAQARQGGRAPRARCDDGGSELTLTRTRT